VQGSDKANLGCFYAPPDIIRFNKVIAKIKRCSFFCASVYIDLGHSKWWVYQVSRRWRCTERADKCIVSVRHTSTCTDNSDDNDDDDDDDDGDVSRRSCTDSTASLSCSCSSHHDVYLPCTIQATCRHANKEMQRATTTQRNKQRDKHDIVLSRWGY